MSSLFSIVATLVFFFPAVASMSSGGTWAPHPGPQTAFHQRAEFECMYGGAAGGGKSDSLIMEALRQVREPGYSALLLRRSFPELKKTLIKRSHEVYPGAGGKYNSSDKLWTFDWGRYKTYIQFGYLKRDGDCNQYQGAELTYIGFDELTHFTEYQYLYLFSRCRTTWPKLRCYIRAATNPGGVGHAWVKDRFVDAAAPYHTVIDPETGDDRVYIPAHVWDNPTLVETDPGYVRRLLALPDELRKAMLDGDWDIFEGQFLKRWRRGVHVMEPFKIPASWPRFCGLDWGYAAPFCNLWVAVDPDAIPGKQPVFYTYREHYVAEQETSWHAKRMKHLNGDDKIKGILADPSIFARMAVASHGTGRPGEEYTDKTIADVMARNGATCQRANNDRMAGWMNLREALAWEGVPTAHGFELTRVPELVVFSTCTNLIRTLPSQVHDEINVEDMDTDGEDHAVDALRYVMMHVRKPRPKVERQGTVGWRKKLREKSRHRGWKAA